MTSRSSDSAQRIVRSRRGRRGRVFVAAPPLSVSADSIGVVAFRAAGLLSAFREQTGWTGDRTGTLQQRHRVVEVYPAATLAFLGIRRKGDPSYRGTNEEALSERRRFVKGMVEASGLEFTNLREHEEELVASDHGLDAFVAGLTGALAQRGRTRLPEHSDLAESEGWIHVPVKRF